MKKIDLLRKDDKRSFLSDVSEKVNFIGDEVLKTGEITYIVKDVVDALLDIARIGIRDEDRNFVYSMFQKINAITRKLLPKNKKLVKEINCKLVSIVEDIDRYAKDEKKREMCNDLYLNLANTSLDVSTAEMIDKMAEEETQCAKQFRKLKNGLDGKEESTTSKPLKKHI